MSYRSGSQLETSESSGLKLLLHPDQISMINNFTAKNYLPPPPSSSSSSSSELQTHPDIFDSKSSLPAKVCMICCLDDSYVAVFIVDLKTSVNGDGGFVSTAPTFLIDRDSLGVDYVFCVMNSTLYMFERGRWDIYDPQCKSVYTHDLSTFVNGGVSPTPQKDCNLILDKSTLTKGTEMQGPKSKPFATPTPDGKRILVFSSCIPVDPSSSLNAERFDFELYTPAENTWMPLPSLYAFVMETRSDAFILDIKSYTFVSDSVLLICTDKLRNFTIDIDSPSLGWKHEYSFAGGRDIPFRGPFFVIGDEFCVTASGGIYDIGNKDWFAIEKLATSVSRSSFGDCFEQDGLSFCLATILDDDIGKGEGEFHFVLFQSAINQETMFAHLLLDVCSCNLAKYREDKRRESEKIEDQRGEDEKIEDQRIEDQRRREDQKIEDRKIGDAIRRSLATGRRNKIDFPHGGAGEGSKKITTPWGRAALRKRRSKIEDERRVGEKIVQVEVSIVKSLKFVLDNEQCESFFPLNLLPLY